MVVRLSCMLMKQTKKNELIAGDDHGLTMVDTTVHGTLVIVFHFSLNYVAEKA